MSLSTFNHISANPFRTIHMSFPCKPTDQSHSHKQQTHPLFIPVPNTVPSPCPQHCHKLSKYISSLPFIFNILSSLAFYRPISQFIFSLHTGAPTIMSQPIKIKRPPYIVGKTLVVFRSPSVFHPPLWYNKAIIGKNILLQQGEIGKVVHARI